MSDTRLDFKPYHSLPLATRVFIRMVLKPSLDAKEEKQATTSLDAFKKPIQQSVITSENKPLQGKNESFQQGNQLLNFFSFTPIDPIASNAMETKIVDMAVIYVPGNLETVGGQYRNLFLQTLCHSLQIDLQRLSEKTQADKNTRVKLSLFMMDYYGRSSNHSQESNYTHTPLVTDAENIAGLTRHLVEHHRYPVENILIIGHSIGGHVALWAKMKLDQDAAYHSLKILLDRTYGKLELPFFGNALTPALIEGGYMLSPDKVMQAIESSPGIFVLNAHEDTLMRRNSLVDTLKQTASTAAIKGRLFDASYNGRRRSSLVRTHQAFFQELALGVPWLTPIELIAALLSNKPIPPDQISPHDYFQKKLTAFKQSLNAQYKHIVEAWIANKEFLDDADKIEFNNLKSPSSSKRIHTRFQLYTAYNDHHYDAEKEKLSKTLTLEKDKQDFDYDCAFIETLIKKELNNSIFISTQIDRYGNLFHKLQDYFIALAEHEELSRSLLANNWHDIFKNKSLSFTSAEAKFLMAEATHCAAHYSAFQQNLQDFNERIKKLAFDPKKNRPEKSSEIPSAISIFKPVDHVSVHFRTGNLAGTALKAFRNSLLENKLRPILERSIK